MPTYPYQCPHCSNTFEVIKTVARINYIENCSDCGAEAERRIARVNFSGGGDWQEAYNPAFGCVVKSKAHQREILAKHRDNGREFIEVGTEPVENIHKHYDNRRAETSNKRWSESAEKILQETMS